MDDKTREQRPEEMGRPWPDERDAEVMGRRPEPGTAEVMGEPEPDEEQTDVMGGPGRPTDVMRDRGRSAGAARGPGKRPDVMGGPGRHTDVMPDQARRAG